jgi:hypothetical protein
MVEHVSPPSLRRRAAVFYANVSSVLGHTP